MVIMQKRSKRKPTGAKYKNAFPKRLSRTGGRPALTKLGETRRVNSRVRGGITKTSNLHIDTVNLFDPKTKKFSQEKIKVVGENPANRHFQRRNILAKGSMIETAKGPAKITSRPGQTGSVNAILITKK